MSFTGLGSDGRQLHCDYVGERLAIEEFNRQSSGQSSDGHKLCHTRINTPSVKFAAPWQEQLWVYHRFGHAEYNTHIAE